MPFFFNNNIQYIQYDFEMYKVVLVYYIYDIAISISTCFSVTFSVLIQGKKTSALGLLYFAVLFFALHLFEF